MANFKDAIKTDKKLQQEVADAIKKVALSNGLTLEDKSYDSDANFEVKCVRVAWTVVCTA